MKYYATLSLTICAVAFGLHPTVAKAETLWAERYFNPVPLADDLVLPMPCGGAMAFRPVQTPNAEGTVGDVRVTLGQEGDEAPYLNGLRRSYISGGFRVDGDNPKGQFYLGKYEIADAQWDAMMNESCPEKSPRARAFTPVVEKSPLQMAQFAEKYTLWLLNDANDSLPTAENTKGYLRLPTEDEWEFAARGGLSVSDVSFRAPRPEIPDGTSQTEFIAHVGTESAGGRVQIIGSLNANALGLHDMLGNVAEVVDTPFSLVRHGRLHGQAGGVIKRGGDARTPINLITSATRFEVPPYNVRNKSPFADSFTGFRLAIAGLAITSSEQTEQMIVDLDRIAQPDGGSAVNAAADIDSVLSSLEDQLDTPQSLQQLAVVRDNIAASRAENNAQRNRSVRLLMESGTHICDQAVGRLRNAQAVSDVFASYDEIEDDARAAGDQALLDEVEIARAEATQKFDDIMQNATRDLEDFGNVVEGLGDDHSLSLLTRQISFVAPKVERGGARRTFCLSALEEALANRAAQGFTDLDKIEVALSNIAQNESN